MAMLNHSAEPIIVELNRRKGCKWASELARDNHMLPALEFVISVEDILETRPERCAQQKYTS